MHRDDDVDDAYDDAHDGENGADDQKMMQGGMMQDGERGARVEADIAREQRDD